jgi:hypothetical protein
MYIYIYIYVYICICMYVCMYVCVSVPGVMSRIDKYEGNGKKTNFRISYDLLENVCAYVCMYVCMYVHIGRK